jgi:hypothetical protein
MHLCIVVGGLIKKEGMMAAVELRVDIIFAGNLTGALLILIIRVSMLEQDGKILSARN